MILFMHRHMHIGTTHHALLFTDAKGNFKAITGDDLNATSRQNSQSASYQTLYSVEMMQTAATAKTEGKLTRRCCQLGRF